VRRVGWTKRKVVVEALDRLAAKRGGTFDEALKQAAEGGGKGSQTKSVQDALGKWDRQWRLGVRIGGQHKERSPKKQKSIE